MLPEIVTNTSAATTAVLPLDGQGYQGSQGLGLGHSIIFVVTCRIKKNVKLIANC